MRDERQELILEPVELEEALVLLRECAPRRFRLAAGLLSSRQGALEGCRLLDETAWEKCTLFDVNFRPDGMSVSELERGLLELGQRLYSAEEKKSRMRAFRRQYQKRWQPTPIAEGVDR